MRSQQCSRVTVGSMANNYKNREINYKSHSNEQKNLKWEMGVGDLSTDKSREYVKSPV